MRGLLGQAIEAFTSFDARLVRSIRYLFNRPGELTLLYLQGSRKPYIGPFALFLLANVLFLAMESLTNSNIFSAPLGKHLHNQPWSDLAQQLVSDRMDATRATLDLYTPIFDKAVARNAKSLVILMVLPLAVLPPVMFRHGVYPFIAHVVFSLHFHAFMLLLFSFALLVPGVSVLLGGVGLASQSLDDTMAICMLVFCAVYLYLATGTVYGGEGAIRVFKAVVLVVAAAIIVLGYRFLLLLITLYST